MKYLLFLILIFCFACNEPGGYNNDKQTVKADAVTTTHKEDYRGDSITMGHKLFSQNCAACHTMSGFINGPSLKDFIGKVPQPSAEWLRKYIKNNITLMKSGDVDAKRLFADNDKVAMPAFDTILTDAQINYIILFLKNPPKEMLNPDRY